MNQKVKCDICQKKELIAGSEGVYISHYRGIFRNDEKIHVCYECYKSKEQEYLQNYAVIYTYDKDHLKRKGTGCVKADYGPCYEDKKDQNGKILEQQNCSHCQPWKFPNNNPKTCSECGKKYFDNQINWTYKVDGEKKNFCSSECLGKWMEKNKPQQNNPPKSPNDNQNKGIPTSLKAFFWIGGILLIIIFTGMFAYKSAKKKKKEIIIIYDHK